MQERLQSLRVRISEIEAEKDSTVKAGHGCRHEVSCRMSQQSVVRLFCLGSAGIRTGWVVIPMPLFESSTDRSDGSAAGRMSLKEGSQKDLDSRRLAFGMLAAFVETGICNC